MCLRSLAVAVIKQHDQVYGSRRKGCHRGDTREQVAGTAQEKEAEGGGGGGPQIRSRQDFPFSTPYPLQLPNEHHQLGAPYSNSEVSGTFLISATTR